jgi:hypothetical protein
MEALMTAWWANLSVARKAIAALLAACAGGAGIGSALTMVSAEDRFRALERTDSVLVAHIAEIKLNTCLTLVEVRGEPNADRCRP